MLEPVRTTRYISRTLTWSHYHENRLNFSEAIAARGIDAASEIANLKRRQRYALTCDRTKVFASTPLGSIPSPWNYDRNGRRITNGTIEADLHDVETAGLVIHHVARWRSSRPARPTMSQHGAA